MPEEQILILLGDISNFLIFFHLDQSFFPNGYLGVDIFFVISGFVITKSIIKNIRNNKFSFLEFYFKRIKRILPVFLVVLLTTIILLHSFS